RLRRALRRKLRRSSAAVATSREGHRSPRAAQSSTGNGTRNDALHHAQSPAILDHSRALPQGDGYAPPALAGGAVGSECNLVVLDAGDVLHDAFAVTGPRIDAEGEMRSRRAHVSGSESADTSSLASFKTASRTCQLTAATSASWSISSRTCCQCGRSSRSLPIAARYSHACKIVRSVPPSFVGMGGVSFFERYAGRNMA